MEKDKVMCICECEMPQVTSDLNFGPCCGKCEKPIVNPENIKHWRIWKT